MIILRSKSLALIVLLIATVVFSGCEKTAPQEKVALKAGMVLDTGGDHDRGFNEYSLKGARDAAAKAGIEFVYLASESTSVYERNIDQLIADGANLIFTVGFALANATAKAALRYPERHFVIMDYAYSPGNGCAEDVEDCYSEAGGLNNVTSLLFAEDQPAYLAGVLAACMTESGVIAAVAGAEIPPVVRFVEGFCNGARSVNPDITTYKRYIPDFNDEYTGRVVATDFINKGADVLFCPGGTTGLGGLLGAKLGGVMAIGADVDQSLTYPEVADALITSVVKNVDVAAAMAVKDFAAGTLEPGVKMFDLSNDAVALAPYHQWEERVPVRCRELVEQARSQILTDRSVSLPRVN